MLLSLGSPPPAFTLADFGKVGAKPFSLASAAPGRPIVVMFICNHCPFVKHIRAELAKLGKDYMGKATVVAINPNDVENYPDDRPELMTAEAAAAGYSFPYLYDETQETAKAYSAACTPDFFVFDSTHKLSYRGQLDASRPGNGVPVTGADLRAAIDAAIGGKPANIEQQPSMGCNIKWKEGNEPTYHSA